jgi:mRNA-degrading endonuclease RelE of RelBE toxin-antitoxin system
MTGPRNGDLKDGDVTILKTFIEEYRKADKKERRQVSKRAFEKVKKASPDLSVIVSKTLKSVSIPIILHLHTASDFFP